MVLYFRVGGTQHTHSPGEQRAAQTRGHRARPGASRPLGADSRWVQRGWIIAPLLPPSCSLGLVVSCSLPWVQPHNIGANTPSLTGISVLKEGSRFSSYIP